jgi:hypothetical protein
VHNVIAMVSIFMCFRYALRTRELMHNVAADLHMQRDMLNFVYLPRSSLSHVHIDTLKESTSKKLDADLQFARKAIRFKLRFCEDCNH